MQPVSIRIEGEFWDSQIYSGELMLFDRDGSTHRVEWASVIDQMASARDSIQTALRVAFADSDLFYTPKVRKILRDPSIERPIRQQLHELASLDMGGTRTLWRRFWRTTPSPFRFLPLDTDVYYNYVLAASDEGVFSAPRSANSAQRALRHHDGRVLQVKGSNQHTAVAAAAGADGLFEFSLQQENGKVLDNKRRLAPRPCSACDWAFHSIVAWTNDTAFMASFREDRDPRTRKKRRTFDGVIDQAQILGEQPSRGGRYSRLWGSHEKVFCASLDGIDVLDYQPPVERTEEAKHSPIRRKASFSRRGKVSVDLDATSIIATGTAPFGSVLEFENELLVMRSDGETERFPGSPIHWRVFPRSEHYSNQLHVIYEDHIRIISFVHDYFVEQKKKLMGFVRGTDKVVLSSEDFTKLIS